MRKIFFILLFPLLQGYAQVDAYLTSGDSTLIATKYQTATGTFIMVFVKDTSGGSTDTLVAECYNTFTESYYTLAVQEVDTRTWVSQMIPGDGSQAAYWILYPTPHDVRIRRTNVANIGSLTRVSIKYYSVD